MVSLIVSYAPVNQALRGLSCGSHAHYFLESFDWVMYEEMCIPKMIIYVVANGEQLLLSSVGRELV